MQQILLNTLLGFIFTLALSNTAYSAEFDVMSTSLPPYSINKGLHLDSISVDTLVMIMSFAGSPLETDDVKLMLWNHAFRKTVTGPTSVMINVPKTMVHEKMFKWVGPIHDNRYVLIGRKDNSKKISNIREIFSLKTAIIRESVSQKALLKAGVPASALVPASTHITPLKQLKNKKIDFFAYDDYSAAYFMKSMGMNTDDYKVFYTIEKVPLYYAFSKDTDDKLIKRLNENLRTMKRPGPDGKSRFDKIVAKYLPGGTIH